MSDDKSDSRIPPQIRKYLFPESHYGKMLRDIGAVLSIALLAGVLLFLYTGLWPPFVSVTSGSMDPNMQEGDLIVVYDIDKTTSDEPHVIHGVVPQHQAQTEGLSNRFGQPGDVIVYEPKNGGSQMIIHRAMFWVEEGENWHDRANPDYISAEDCDSLPNCPAPNAGFITKGDANEQYDQVVGFSDPVPQSNIHGTSQHRIPYVGWIRIGLAAVVMSPWKGYLSNPTS